MHLQKLLPVSRVYQAPKRMRNAPIPDLTFPQVILGRHETPWTLIHLLYHGCCDLSVREFVDLEKKGQLGEPIFDRIELVKRLHNVISANLVGGGSSVTARRRISELRRFFAWSEKNNFSLNLAGVKDAYLHWTDSLLHRVRIVADLKEITARSSAVVVGGILDQVLGRRTKIIGMTRISKSRRTSSSQVERTDKQNLEETFAFGYAIADICSALSIEAIWGDVPVRVSFRTGVFIDYWCGRIPSKKQVEPKNAIHRAWQKNNAKVSAKALEAFIADRSLRTRYPIVNLRIQAELLMFIAQTGMNLGQAHTIKTGDFHYSSYLDGYQVRRRYKARRHGDVEFEIFEDYRVHFERYLEWRRTIFPDEPDGLMFPLVREGGRSVEKAPGFFLIKKICCNLGIRYIGPALLRKTRINWVMRRSRDDDLTADMAQHSKQTLLQVYEQPNLQVAMIEIARFHQKNDPAIAPPGPGSCVSVTPLAAPAIPAEATQPDCINAAGCLFCTNNRDIDSQDHVWSLASFRYLKTLELARFRPSEQSRSIGHPALAAIDRITAKLKFYEGSSEVRSIWVREAQARVTEGAYHPMWDGFIRLQDE